MWFRIIPAVFLAMVVLPGALAAQEDKDRAVEKFKEGVVFYDNKDFEGAIKSFEEAWQFNPSWKLLYNIGQCQAALKWYGPAVESFERYLAEGGDAVAQTRRDEVLAELDRLRQMIGDLEVVAEDGLEVYVDGVLRGRTPLPGAIPVAASIVHTVELKKEGEVIYTGSKSVRAGTSAKVVHVEKADDQQVEVVVTSPQADPVATDAAATAAPTSTTIDTTPPPQHEKKRRKITPIPFWVCAGATVAFGATAIAMTAVVGANNDDVGTQSEADRLNAMRGVGIASLFTAIAAGIATGVLIPFTDFKGERHSATNDRPFVSFYGANREGGIVLQGRF